MNDSCHIINQHILVTWSYLLFSFVVSGFFLVGSPLCCCASDKVDCCYLVPDAKFYDVVLAIGLLPLSHHSIIRSYLAQVLYTSTWR